MASPIENQDIWKYPDLHGDILQSHYVYKIVFWTIFGVYTLYTAVTFSLYLHYVLRVQDKALLERSIYLTCLQVFFGFIYCINGIFHSSIMDYPCYVDIWLLYVSYVPWSVTLILTMARFYTRKQTGDVLANEMQDVPVTLKSLDDQLENLRAICTENTDMVVDQQGSSQQNIYDVAPFLAIPAPQTASESQSELISRSHVERQRRTSLRDIRMVKWRRRFSSNSFTTYVIAATVAIQIILMIFFTIFSRKMSLKTAHHNCIRGWEFLPIIVFSGIFNVLVSPLFSVIVWSQQDGYGIRTSLVVSSVMGVCFWVASLVWPLLHHRATIFISASLFFLAQVIFVYTTTLVVPLVVSIRLARRKRVDSNAELTRNESSWLWSTSAYRRQYGNSKAAFMEAMQDCAEHNRIKTFAQSCFCEELIMFLNIYVSLKQVIITSYEFTPPPQSPAIANKHLFTLTPELKPGSTPRAHTAPSFINRHFSRSRTPTISAERSCTGESSVSNRALADYSIGILASLQKKFPGEGFNGSSVVPEKFKSTISIIIKTFILPDSVLAINATDDIIAACRSYLSGGQLAIVILDRAKDQVLDLLYTNVYLRINRDKA